MTWAVPDWYALVLLALAAWRVWRLLAHDTILDRPREWLLSRYGEKREGEFLLCPFCLGFWVSLAWWAFWIVTPRWSLVVAAPFAISALLALIEINLGPEE